MFSFNGLSAQTGVFANAAELGGLRKLIAKNIESFGLFGGNAASLGNSLGSGSLPPGSSKSWIA